MILCVVLGITFGLLSDYSERSSIILSSAFGGAYLILKGIGMLAGNYPDEFTLAERIKLHQFDTLPAAYYVYLGLMVGLGIAGGVIQFKYSGEGEDENALTNDRSYDDAYISIDKNDLSLDMPRKSTARSSKL